MYIHHHKGFLKLIEMFQNIGEKLSCHVFMALEYKKKWFLFYAIKK